MFIHIYFILNLNVCQTRILRKNFTFVYQYIPRYIIHKLHDKKKIFIVFIVVIIILYPFQFDFFFVFKFHLIYYHLIKLN